MLSETFFSKPEHRARRSIRQGFLFIFGLAAMLLIPRPALAVGLDPVPVFDRADVQAEVQFQPGSIPRLDRYIYTYTIGNPPSNTGEIWQIKIDASEPFAQSSIPFDPSLDDLTLPFGADEFTFREYLKLIQPLFLPPGAGVVPIGEEVPPGWIGAFGRDGFAAFASGEPTTNIQPGQSLGGFKIISPRVPTLRPIQVIPRWVLLVGKGHATEEELDQAADVELNLLFTTFTLGPSPDLRAGSFGRWSKLREDLNRMIDELGWVDPTLGATLRSQLAAARSLLDAGDGTAAKGVLQTLLDTLAQAPAGQLRPEARQLVRLNAEALIASTRDTPIAVEPKLTVTPKVTALPIGTQYTLTAKVVNAAVFLDDALYHRLTDWIDRHYRDRLTLDDLIDPTLITESRAALDELTQVLNLAAVYPFQQQP